MSFSPTHSTRLIQKHDPDRFFLSLLAPRDVQPDITAIIAFYYETARTRDMVTDTIMGLIRLQWWKDALRNYYASGALAPHEIFVDIAAAITRHNIPQEILQNILLAREFDVEDKVPMNIDGLKLYIDSTQGPLWQSIANIMGDDRTDVPALARAYGMIGIIRAFVVHARARRCYLPADHIRNIEDVYAFKNLENLKPIVKSICDEVVMNLKTARADTALFKGMKKLILLYAAQIKQADYNPAATSLLIPPKFKQLRVFLAPYFD